MLPNTWIAGGAAVLLALAGTYLQGRADGRAACQAKAAKQVEAQRKATEAAQAKIDQLEVQYEQARAARDSNARAFRSKAVTISHGADYSRPCLDPNGLRLLNDAIASANARQPQPAPALP